MPRSARIDAPGVLHHIIGRGIERRDVFLGDADRDDFIARLGALAQSGAWDVCAWALMRNHFHLVVETPHAHLVAGMRWLLSAYSIVLNHRHKLLARHSGEPAGVRAPHGTAPEGGDR